MFPTKFRFIRTSGFRREDILKSTNQKKEFTVVAMFVNESERNEQSLQRTFHRCFLPSFSSFGKEVSEEKIFRNRPIRNKNCLWRPCLLANQDDMSNFHEGPAIDASYEVSVHFAKWFLRRRFDKNRPIRNKNCLWRPCLLTDRDEMCNLQRGSSIDDSYQVSVDLTKWFQRRRFVLKSNNQNKELPVAAMFVSRSGQNMQSVQKTFHRCFLPSFSSFD